MPSQFLAIDVGNSHTLFGVLRGHDVVHTIRITTRDRSTDELGALLLQLLAHRGVPAEDLEGAIASCVVPGHLYTVEKAVRRYLGLDLLTVGKGLKTGLRIRTDNPREVGADRIVNAVAATSRFAAPLIVVDLGTATLVDCVDRRGDYVGGAIAPGFQVSQRALEGATARLPGSAIARPPSPIGKNTVHALQAGMYWGFVGLVDGIVRRLRAELGDGVTVIATGEWSSLIGPASEEVDVIESWLTLQGLATLYDRNRP